MKGWAWAGWIVLAGLCAGDMLIGGGKLPAVLAIGLLWAGRAPYARRLSLKAE